MGDKLLKLLTYKCWKLPIVWLIGFLRLSFFITNVNVLNVSSWRMYQCLNLFDFTGKLMMIPSVRRIAFQSSVLDSRITIVNNCKFFLVLSWNDALIRLLHFNLPRLFFVFLYFWTFLLKWRHLFRHEKYFTIFSLIMDRLIARILFGSIYFWSFPKKLNFFSQVIDFFVFLNDLDL